MQEEPIICSNCNKEVRPTEKVEQAVRRGEIVVDGLFIYPDTGQLKLNCPDCTRLRLTEPVLSQRNITTE